MTEDSARKGASILPLLTRSANTSNTRVNIYFHPIHHTILIDTRSGGPELLSQLEADSTLTSNESAKQGLSDMAILFNLLKAYNALDKVSTCQIIPISFLNSSMQISFDLSPARGLDYYTGIIYEAIVEGSAPSGFKAANAFAAPLNLRD